VKIELPSGVLDRMIKQTADGAAILQEEITGAAADSAKTIALGAIAKAPVKTGRLRRSITSEVVPLAADVQGIVMATAPYARYVEEGTGLYGPKKAVILYDRMHKFKIGGSWVSVLGIRGMQAKPYMKPAFEEARERVVGLFRDAIFAAVKRVVGP